MYNNAIFILLYYLIYQKLISTEKKSSMKKILIQLGQNDLWLIKSTKFLILVAYEEYLVNFPIRSFHCIVPEPGRVDLFKVIQSTTFQSQLLVFIAHNLADKKLFVDEKMTSKEFPLKNLLFIWIKRFNFLSMNLKLLCAYFSLVLVIRSNLMLIQENSSPYGFLYNVVPNVMGHQLNFLVFSPVMLSVVDSILF